MIGILVTSLILAGTAPVVVRPPTLGDQHSYEQLQPIVLTDVPTACASPAHLAGPVMQTDLVPLPTGPQWRGYAAVNVAPMIEYRVAAPMVAPAERLETLRPVVTPSLPEGYVVGRGLLGQPKLYKPGQPMRNFLRYLSP